MLYAEEEVIQYLAPPKKRLSVHSPQRLTDMARNGLKGRHLAVIRQRTGLDVQTLARIFQVTPRTLQNKKSTDTLSITVSEKMLALVRLFLRGTQVFGSEDKFKKWLNAPNPVLEAQRPLDVLDTMFGFELLDQLLGRLEHGVLS